MKQRLRSVFLRLVSFCLLLSVLFSGLAINVSAADSVQTVKSADLSYNCTVHGFESTTPPMNITYDIVLSSITLQGYYYTRFILPDKYYKEGNSFDINFDLYDRFTLRADHEYNLSFYFRQSFSIPANFNAYVYIYNSNGSIYKQKELYAESIKTNDRVELDFNFYLAKSDLPDGYYCRLELSFYQLTSGNSVSTASQSFCISEYITLTDLDDNSSWFQKIIDAITSIPDKISNFFSNLGNIIGSFFSDLWNNLKTQFENIGRWFSDLGDKIGQFFEKLYNDIIEGLKNLFIPHDGYFSDYTESWKAWASDHLGILYQIGDIIVSILDKIGGLFDDKYLFTFPEISVPINGTKYVFVEERTVDMMYWISSQPTTARLYSIYTASVWAILVFCLLRYAFKLETIILGTVISA